MDHVLVDLETLGNGSKAAIVAIGAVAFDPYGGQITHPLPEFYTLVNLESSLKLGLEANASTILWWLKQSDAARAALTAEPGVDILTALDRFSTWYGGARFWCHGAMFDAVIMANAYQLAGKYVPFSHRDVRCTRTLFELAGMDKTKTGGVQHHALDDAKRHAADVQAAYRKLGLTNG